MSPGSEAAPDAELLEEPAPAIELIDIRAGYGRVEVLQMWGRPESVRGEFKRRRAQ